MRVPINLWFVGRAHVPICIPVCARIRLTHSRMQLLEVQAEGGFGRDAADDEPGGAPRAGGGGGGSVASGGGGGAGALARPGARRRELVFCEAAELECSSSVRAVAWLSEAVCRRPT